MKATVERMINGGFGLAKVEGRTIFVERGVPGETVELTVTGKLGGTPVAVIDEVIEASPARVAPPCVYYERCGGCDFQHIEYGAQVEIKREVLRDALQHLGKMAPPQDFSFIAAPNPLHYRSRAEWHCDADLGTLGYFGRGGKVVTDVENCIVLAERLQQAMTGVRADLLSEERLKKPAEIAAVSNGQQVSLHPNVAGLGEKEIVVEALGERYQLDARCFFQSNLDLLEQLVSEVMREFAAPQVAVDRATVAIDLYAGVGLFTLPLARKFSQVYGVEGSDHGVGFGRRNARTAGLTNVQFDMAPVERWVKQRLGSLGLVDCMVVDPPRSGLGSGLVESIVTLQPQTLVYVSCDPATLARDLKGLVGGGYVLTRLTGIDMFPQTSHIETVAHLSPGGA